MENKIIKLNVGGHKYYTTESTLLSAETNFFHALLAADKPLKDDKGNND